MRTLWSKLLAVFHRDRLTDDLAEEAEAHFEMEVEARRREGMPEAQARAEARRHFGNRTQLLETSRESWVFGPLEDFFRDLRYGWRNMRRAPVFTAVALITLALGIGGNTVIFSAINGILIEHLPYARASQLLVVTREQIAWGVTRDEARIVQLRCSACEQFALSHRLRLIVTMGDALPEYRGVAYVSGGFFPLLGVKPILGRTLIPADEEGLNRVAVLSYRYWKDLGGDPNIAGREILVNRAAYSIVGVMPDTFELGVAWGSEKEDGLWVPLESPRPRERFSNLIARVRAGMSVEVAKEQIRSASPFVAGRFPPGEERTNLIAETPRRGIGGDIRAGLLILQGAVAFVLLLASVNISSLLIARSWSRQRELGVRRALGASRLRIFRQLFSESLLLAMTGGLFGLLFSIAGIRVLRAIAPPDTPRLDRLRLDSDVFWFTLAVSLGAAVLFGLMPAIQASANRAIDGMHSGLNAALAGAALPRRRKLRNALLFTEVALATVVVVGAGLLVRSFTNLMWLDPGVRADRTLSMSVEFSDLTCNPTCEAATRTILDRVRSLAGVELATVSANGPLNGGMHWNEIQFAGDPVVRPFDGAARSASPGFFETAGMRVLKGRDFLPSDTAEAAIVSEQFTRDYIHGNPLGRRFSTHKDQQGRPVWQEIVGEVNNTRNRAVRQFGSAAVYYTPQGMLNSRWQLLARTAGDPGPLVQPLQRIVRSVDKDAIIANVHSLEQELSESAALPRFHAGIFGAFGFLALLLAAIGIFGVTSYSVQQRTKEIGIRMALGARAGRVMAGIVARGGVLALCGIAAGIFAARAFSRFLESMLFGVPPVDGSTYAAGAALLFATALLAFYLPARAAARVDPVHALRHD